MTLRLCVVSNRVRELEEALADRLPDDVESGFYARPDEVEARLLDADIALGAPDMLAELLPRLPRLRWAQSTWAGVKPLIDHPRRDYRLTGVKDIFGRSMSEYVLGWLLALKRRVLIHAQRKRWEFSPEQGLTDLHVGIAGVGSIGSAVAQSLSPFVAEVRGLNSDGRAVPGCDRCFGLAAREHFSRDLDALVLLLPHTAATDGIVDDPLIATLAPGAVLINAGRANALDLPAAINALETRQLSACVLDVLSEEPLPDEDPLWQVPGLYITSHTAAPTESAAIAEIFLDNLRRYREGSELSGLVDLGRGY